MKVIPLNRPLIFKMRRKRPYSGRGVEILPSPQSNKEINAREIRRTFRLKALKLDFRTIWSGGYRRQKFVIRCLKAMLCTQDRK